MDDFTTSHQDLLVAVSFKVQGVLDEVKGVDVLHFRLGPILVGAVWAHGNVGVDPHRPLFHLNIGDPGKLDPLAQGFQVGNGFFWRSDVGLRNNFDQRRPLPVQVHVRVTAGVGVLPGVFFDVHFLDPDLFLLAVDFDFHPAIVGDRRLRLGDLVGLWVIRVEVVLTVKVHLLGHFGVQS